MSIFSVKKPLTVFVVVIAILVVGVVAYTNMTPDLLPSMDFPYVMIMTTYPGATPEKVEEEISKPMEQSMSTLEHIKEVTSTSSENVSMVILEFEDSVNLDAIGVDIQQQISTLSAAWDDTVGTPYVLKINPNMMPVEVAAMSMEGMDTIELTEFLNDTLMTKLEGIPGVARITTTGMVEQELHVVLDQKLIDKMNQKIADAINGELDEAADELEEQKQELENAKSEMADAQSQLSEGADALAEGEAKLQEEKAKLVAAQEELEKARIPLLATYETLNALNGQVDNVVSAQQTAQSRYDEVNANIAAKEQEINDLQAQIDAIDQQISDLENGGTAEGGSDPEDDNDTENGGGTENDGGTEDTPAAAAELPAAEDDTPAAQNAAFAVSEKIPVTVDLGYGVKAVVYQDAQNPKLSRLSALSNETEIALLKAERERLQAELTAAQAGLESAKAELPGAQTNLDAANDAVDAIDQVLASQGTDRAGLTAAVSETKAQLDQVTEAQEQLDTGMMSVEEAEAMLEQQTLSGMLQMGAAAGQLAAGSATIEQALTQIESGMETLEDSREDALRQSDLNNIITMEMVTQILNAQNFAMPAGYVEEDGVNYMVSVGDEITDLETLENLLLLDMQIEGLDPIYLKDVAVVMVTDNSAETYARLNGQNGVMLSFEKQSNYATAETTDSIEARFRELEKEFPGLKFVSLMNQGDYIYMVVESILNNIFLGAVFSVLVLILFLRDIRPTFITLCSIPISVIFAIVLMYFSGITLNMISLSGLAVAVGMLVDNSVVVIENIYRLRAKGANVIQAAVSGAAQVTGSVVASTLTTVCVFLPIVFVEGITRQLFVDLALTMSYALIASLIISLTLVPAMASGMLRKEKVQKPGILEKYILPGYEKILRWSLKYKPVVLIFAVVLLVFSVVAALANGYIFMPTMDSATVSVSVTMPEGVDMEEASALADDVLERIGKVEGIANVGAMMSGSELSLLGGGAGYNVTVYVLLEDENASGAAIGKQIEEACAGMDCTVTASSAMMDMSMLTGSGVSMNIYADDMEVLQSAARKAAEILSEIEGIAEVSDGLEDAAPALHVAIDRNEAMKNGLTVAQVYMELAAGLTADGTVASLELDGISTDIIIEKPEGAVLDAGELRDYVFEVTDKEGETKEVPLSDFAVVEETTSLATINRVNQRRYLTVTAELEEGYNVTLMTTQAEEAMKNVDLGEGVSYLFTGENETIMESMEQLMLMLALGMLLVYLVMVAQFQSLKSPFIVMFTIPLAFTGGFLALLLCDMEVSVISMIGFVMLVGLIVNNGIVLVDYINQLRLEGVERREAIVEAGITRMRPILMTILTTVMSQLVTATSKDASSAIMQPISVVCIGGLLYATLMTLFVVPCIYDMLNKKELRNVREEDLKLLDI